jgi:alpha-beta hydrolase superfamily lysophospholipase
MIEITNEHFESSSGRCAIHVAVWTPDSREYAQPVGVIQIAHGMIDHIERFNDMAMYFAGKGYVVAGNDHLGHGDSVSGKDDWGYFYDTVSPETSGMHLVEDMHRLTRIMKNRYPNLPYIIIGHSMGSFMLRRYLMQFGTDVDAAVILGTGNQSMGVVCAGIAAARVALMVKGDRCRSRVLSKLMFGSYNKRIKNPKSSNAWISRDEAVVEAYDNDEKCSFLFTPNGYLGFLNIIKYDIQEKNVKKTPSNLPVLFASGSMDPVGQYGKGVKRAFDMYAKYLDDVELRLYDDCRHELHSELNREEIFRDIYDWIEERIRPLP